MYQVINTKNLVDHGFGLVLFPHIDLILISERENNKSLYSMTLTKGILRYGRNSNSYENTTYGGLKEDYYGL